MDKLYIVIPAYNEEENIASVIKDWYPIVEKIGEDSRLVIVNDGSKDDTYNIVFNEAQNRPQLVPLTKENEGHGATLLFGYNWAIDQGADYIFQTDSDGQTLPEEFWQFWECRHQYKMIIGHRNQREDGISRIFVTKILKLVIWLSFGVSIKDANTPFRLMEVATLKEYIQLVPEKFNLSNVMLAVIYKKRNIDIKWFPITFRPRQGGINSINMKRIVKIGKQAVLDFRVINKGMGK